MVWESLTACSPPSVWYAVSTIRRKCIRYLRIVLNQHILRSAFLNSIDSRKLWTLLLLVKRQWFPSCSNICYCSYCFRWSNDTDFKTEITVVRPTKAMLTIFANLCYSGVRLHEGTHTWIHRVKNLYHIVCWFSTMRSQQMLFPRSAEPAHRTLGGEHAANYFRTIQGSSNRSNSSKRHVQIHIYVYSQNYIHMISHGMLVNILRRQHMLSLRSTERANRTHGGEHTVIMTLKPSGAPWTF